MYRCLVRLTRILVKNGFWAIVVAIVVVWFCYQCNTSKLSASKKRNTWIVGHWTLSEISQNHISFCLQNFNTATPQCRKTDGICVVHCACFNLRKISADFVVIATGCNRSFCDRSFRPTKQFHPRGFFGRGTPNSAINDWWDMHCVLCSSLMCNISGLYKDCDR